MNEYDEDVPTLEEIRKNVSIGRINRFFDTDNLIEASAFLEKEMTVEDMKFSTFLWRLGLAHHEFVQGDRR